jgi:hypothetical protein
MRWVLVTFESFATGVLAVVVSVVALITGMSMYTRYVLGQGSNGAVGWDVVSLFGQHWKVAIIGIPVGIFWFGGGVGFWFFSQRPASR